MVNDVQSEGSCDVLRIWHKAGVHKTQHLNFCGATYSGTRVEATLDLQYWKKVKNMDMYFTFISPANEIRAISSVCKLTWTSLTRNSEVEQFVPHGFGDLAWSMHWIIVVSASLSSALEASCLDDCKRLWQNSCLTTWSPHLNHYIILRKKQGWP